MLNEIFYEMFKQMPRQGPGKAEYTKDAWDEFYAALEVITIRMQEKYKNNKEAGKIIDYAVREIETYEKFGEFYGYVFFIMKN